MSEHLCGFHSHRSLATTRTLSEVGESSASLVPDPKDRHHLAQTCESLQCRDCPANCDERRANAAPSSSLNLWRAGVEARSDGTSERRMAVSMSAMRARRLQAAIANNRLGPPGQQTKSHGGLPPPDAHRSAADQRIVAAPAAAARRAPARHDRSPACKESKKALRFRRAFPSCSGATAVSRRELRLPALAHGPISCSPGRREAPASCRHRLRRA